MNRQSVILVLSIQIQCKARAMEKSNRLSIIQSGVTYRLGIQFEKTVKAPIFSHVWSEQGIPQLVALGLGLKGMHM